MLNQIAEVKEREVTVKANQNELVKFVERIRLFPSLFGVEFFKSVSYSNKTDSMDSKMHTNVLRPDIMDCIFCQDMKLVNRSLKLAKNPILYAHDKIDYCLFDTKCCPSCQKYHFISYAYDDKTKKNIFIVMRTKKSIFSIATKQFLKRMCLET